MEQAGLSVEPGSVGQLEPDFQLEFDPEAEAEADADGFDIRLDGAYDEVEQGSGEPVVDQSTDLNPAPEIGYEDEEERAESAIHEQAHSETTEDSGKRTEAELEAEVEYQDEIGYEDEDAIATDIDADLGSTEPAEINAVESNVSSEGQSESVRVGEDVSNEAPASGEDAILHQDVDSDEHCENTDPQDNLVDDDEEKTADSTASDHLTAQEFEEMDHEQYNVDRHDEPYPAPSDIDKAIQDLADSLAQVPNIEVLYNETCYSLFGTSDDDPESYFLSDVGELDRPLSQFFASLRAVISSEIGPTDELMIRFDPLDFEFGERSNEKFLSRSLREILDCHAALAAKDSSISPVPTIQLIVQRDSEEHFLELLADVERGDDHSNHSEDLEASEMHDELSLTSLPNDGQVQHESPEGVHSDESSANDHDVFDAAHQDTAAVQPIEGKDESRFETVPDRDDVTREEEYNFQVDADGSRSPSISQDGLGDEDLEPDYPKTQSHFDEHPEETADEDQDWVEQAEDDEPTASGHAELPLEGSDEPQTVHQAGNESGETADLRTADGASTPVDNRYDQEAASNGKYPPSIFPVYYSPYRKQPPSVLHHDDLLIDKLDDGEPIISVPRTEHEPACTSQALCTHARAHAPGLEEAEFWEIDYSDGEYEPSPCSALAGQCATHGRLSSVSLPLELKANSNMHSTNPAGPPCVGKVAERDNTNITFSSTDDANMLAHQGDDLVLALDEAPDLETARDGEGDGYDEYTITYNATENTTDDTEGVDGTYESLIGYDASDSATNNNGAQVAAAAETASVQTSATFDGDEIDYEERNAADDLHTVESDSAQQPLTALGGEDDEIDWENDGDEYEQQPASADEGVEYEERKENALTPSSLAGKRNRTDETESLADETDHKRRRT
ncbi:hypothetical protein MMYC01_203059 [Madurella mycetomatis]|uniref:Uncharacterized protein n=1 Tax=Madurella mycetomatis TaxID=100816 RepID=A0A175W6D9_9PEZI|nr:hypothetical protein MMYC01_203059 [Madurella mycetomatis]